MKCRLMISIVVLLVGATPALAATPACRAVSLDGDPDRAAIIAVFSIPIERTLIEAAVEQINEFRQLHAQISLDGKLVLIEGPTDVVARLDDRDRGFIQPLLKLDSALREEWNLPWRASVVEMSPTRSPGDNRWWAVSKIGAAAAQRRTTGDPATTVAIVDSGVDRTHDDFIGKWWENTKDAPDGLDNDGNSIEDDTYGASFHGKVYGTDLRDEFKHGTLVAGVVAGEPRRDRPGGVAPGVLLMPVRVLDAKGFGSTWSVYQGIQYAAGKDAAIVNLSLQSACADVVVKDVIHWAWQHGTTVVAAAGNGLGVGDDLDIHPSYPPSFNNASLIVVGGTGFVDEKMRTSNHGVNAVDIGAPGRQIWGAWPNDPLHAARDTLHRANGTSFAAPFVSGGLALLTALTRDEWSWLERNAYLLNSVHRCDPAGPERCTDLSPWFASGGRLDLDRLTSAPADVTTPDAGTTWRIGLPGRVTWTQRFPAGACDTLDVRLSLDGGATFGKILHRVGTTALRTEVDLKKIAAAAAGVRAMVRLSCSKTKLHSHSALFAIE